MGRAYTCFSLANKSNPNFDPPAVYLYKVISVTSMAILFSVLFTLAIYPSSARRLLRHQMSDIFNNIYLFYVMILQSMHSKLHPSQIKDLQATIFSQLIALEPLLHFASREPDLTGPFRTDAYKQVIQYMHKLLSRFECMRLCVGDEQFDSDILRVVQFGAYAASRRELHQTIHVLLFMFKSTLLTKLPMLPNLPCAEKARDVVIRELVDMLVLHNKPHGVGAGDPLDVILPMDTQDMLEVLNTDRWSRLLGLNVSSREEARVLDQLGVLLKSVFGEAVDSFETGEGAKDLKIEVHGQEMMGRSVKDPQ
ncbi:hypothetical protein HDU98_008644 [Podochytrium sp. JEL0797]|nr:hypothetical protein HDU98_008644 [Podochytrium sp. JEL0797]